MNSYRLLSFPAFGLGLSIALASSAALSADAPAPLPKADPIQITPIAPIAQEPAKAVRAGGAQAAQPAPAPVPSAQPAGQAAAQPATKPAAAPIPPAPAPLAVPAAGPAAVPAAKPAAPKDPNESIRQALRERMAASGAASNELVIRTQEQTPPINEAIAAAEAVARAKAQAEARAAAAKRAASARSKTPVVPDIPWSYEDGPRGPSAWGKLHTAYAACEKGTFQSPIDLRDGVGVDLPTLNFSFKPSPFKVTDTGKTFQVHLANGGTLSVLGVAHQLSHIEFRHPAEERINGKTHGMSMQLHFRDEQKRMAIVSILLSPTGVENPFIQAIWNHIPLVRNEPVVPPGLMVNILQAMPKDGAYYTYMGSLTTPPCTEGVTWYVMKTPVEVSPDQIAIFGRIYPNNSRPVQPANSRLVKESRTPRMGMPTAATPAPGMLLTR